MGSKPETGFFRSGEVNYLYGVLRIEKMVLILADLLQSPDGLPQTGSVWDREETKHYGDFTASGLVHEISCLVKPLDDKDKEALKKLVALAKSGLELRRKSLTLPGRRVESESYKLQDCFKALPHMLGHSTQRMAEKLDDFELNWLRTFVLLAGGKMIDERKAELIEALRR
ncbi:MAG: hypothetical protein M1575_02010 [Patescibacteria group bacterium]|nr:hypothetical protein [Patescibacteria group bacterium]MCL5095477.1 hypothetical protein [Patescibacteria group bacterium]